MSDYVLNYSPADPVLLLYKVGAKAGVGVAHIPTPVDLYTPWPIRPQIAPTLSPIPHTHGRTPYTATPKADALMSLERVSLCLQSLDRVLELTSRASNSPTGTREPASKRRRTTDGLGG